EHLLEVGPLLLAELLLPLDDQVAVLEHEVRLPLVAGPLALGPLLGPLPGPAALALAAGLAPPGHLPPEAADGVEHLVGDVLQDVEDAQLVARLRPDLRQRCRVEV